MAWYYYSGHVTCAIRVSSTKSVAVRPNTKIEILEVTREVQALLAKGMLRRSGRPVGATSLEDASPPTDLRMEDVVSRSPLATFFAEKGVTTSKTMPPQKAVGAPEYTIHELEMAGSTKPAIPEPAEDVAVLPVEAVADGAEEEVNKGSNRRRRRGH